MVDSRESCTDSSLRDFEKAEAIYLCKSKIKDKSLTLGESKYKLFIDSLFYH